MSAPGFTTVIANPDELADWRLAHPDRRHPKRLRCDGCGKRIWHSGLAIGAHRRKCSVVVTLGGQRYDAAEYLAWTKGGPQPEELS